MYCIKLDMMGHDDKLWLSIHSTQWCHVLSWFQLNLRGCDDMELLISPLADRGGGGGGKRGMPSPRQLGIYPVIGIAFNAFESGYVPPPPPPPPGKKLIPLFVFVLFACHHRGWSCRRLLPLPHNVMSEPPPLSDFFQGWRGIVAFAPPPPNSWQKHPLFIVFNNTMFDWKNNLKIQYFLQHQAYAWREHRKESKFWLWYFGFLFKNGKCWYPSKYSSDVRSHLQKKFHWDLGCLQMYDTTFKNNKQKNNNLIDTQPKDTDF